MTFYIGVEDVAANGLIELLQEDRTSDFISYDRMVKYGSKVVTFLEKKTGDKAVFIMSRDATDAIFRNYSDFFEESIVDNVEGVKLKSGKTVDDLIERFRGYLALKVLLAFIDKCNTDVLGNKT